ncbi:MAG: fumarylacetoacetate hydrolase family protein [Betaproteobacteria bacterium]|jgi:2-keto-4-pentenoate hydratase/2-oxohepta-3-ene-1,7-dioic acid hydratase in catechol pathway|nr:fumarylacetoacetate hydrolase family protein [Betaproteobacteria bacterium]
MRFLNFLHPDGTTRLGVLKDGGLIDLSEKGFPMSLDMLLKSGTALMDVLIADWPNLKPNASLEGLHWLPPILNPSKAIAVGLNYVDHAAESPYKDPPKYPVLFHRFPSSWVGHGQPLIRPKVSTEFDYEGEIAVIIGKAGRYIAKSDALTHVAGYSLFNDGSLRDYQFKSTQWMIGKNFDASGSFGPVMVTADELPLGGVGLQLKTRLNGQVVQDANTRDMIFDVATLVSTCSEVFALQPGDVIISGTPAGVGFARKPPLFMKRGDVAEVEVAEIGVLSNPIVDEA